MNSQIKFVKEFSTTDWFRQHDQFDAFRKDVIEAAILECTDNGRMSTEKGGRWIVYHWMAAVAAYLYMSEDQIRSLTKQQLVLHVQKHADMIYTNYRSKKNEKALIECSEVLDRVVKKLNDYRDQAEAEGYQWPDFDNMPLWPKASNPVPKAPEPHVQLDKVIAALYRANRKKNTQS